MPHVNEEDFTSYFQLWKDDFWHKINNQKVRHNFGDFRLMEKVRPPILKLKEKQKQPPEVFYKKGVLKSVFLIKLQASACNFFKKRLLHKCFTVNFSKFLRSPFLQNTYGWLPLEKILATSSPAHHFPIRGRRKNFLKQFF